MKKITYRDLMSVPKQALMREHKLNTRQFEQVVRSHLDGATRAERQDVYNKVYTERKE